MLDSSPDFIFTTKPLEVCVKPCREAVRNFHSYVFIQLLSVVCFGGKMGTTENLDRNLWIGTSYADQALEY